MYNKRNKENKVQAKADLLCSEDMLRFLFRYSQGLEFFNNLYELSPILLYVQP